MARTNRQKFRFEVLWAARWAFMDAWAEANPKPKPPKVNLPDAPEKPEILGEYARWESEDKPYLYDQSYEVRVEYVRQSKIYNKAYRKWQERCDRLREKHDYEARYNRWLAESEKWWHDRRIAWQQSPEREQALVEEQGLPRRKNPWGDDWHLSKPEGARRPATIRLAREYARTHDAMQEWENGAKEPTCMGCEREVNGSMLCYACRNEPVEPWDDRQPDDPRAWRWAYEEEDDRNAHEILEVMSGSIAFMPRTNEDADLLLA